MKLNPNQLGKIYRQEVAQALKNENGEYYFDRSWLVFSNKKKFFTRYSKFHPDSSCWFYGIEKDIWMNWGTLDHLLFLMPPEEFDKRIAAELKYLVLDTYKAKALITECSNDYNSQKKVRIYCRSSGYEIDRYPFLTSPDLIHTLKTRFVSGFTIERTPESGPPKKVITRRKKARGNAQRTGYLDSLIEHLKKVNCKQVQISLKFKQFSEISGITPPDSAYKDKNWWKSLSKRIIDETGWRIEDTYLPAQTLVFRRKDDDFMDNIKPYVKAVLEAEKPVQPLDSRTLRIWLLHCRRNALYFEGTILYERAFTGTDSLTEIECAEIEEHYQVCKRELNQNRSFEIR